jgi:hypothetical protein
LNAFKKASTPGADLGGTRTSAMVTEFRHPQAQVTDIVQLHGRLIVAPLIERSPPVAHLPKPHDRTVSVHEDHSTPFRPDVFLAFVPLGTEVGQHVVAALEVGLAAEEIVENMGNPGEDLHALRLQSQHVVGAD